MAVVNPPVWLEAGTYTADLDRFVTGLLVDRNYDVAGTLQSIESGVVGPKDQLSVTANGTMNISVGAGMAVVPRQTLTPPGAYLCYNNSATTVSVPTQSSTQRNDILVARVNDSAEGNTGDNWELHLVPGTAASSPTDPTVPANYVKLARINVKSAALNGGVDKITSSQVTDLRNFVASQGGVHVVWNGIYPPSAPGRLVYDTATAQSGQLKLGIGNGIYYTLVPDESRLIRALVYGPQSDYRDATVHKQGNSSGTWDPTPADDGSGTPIGAVNVNASAYYSALYKVSIAALAKCDDANISGHLSLQVRDGSTEVYPAAIGRGPSFYGTFWVYSESTFMVALPLSYIQRSLNFQVMFRCDFTGSGTGSTDLMKWQRIRLIVEPAII